MYILAMGSSTTVSADSLLPRNLDATSWDAFWSLDLRFIDSVRRLQSCMWYRLGLILVSDGGRISYSIHLEPPIGRPAEKQCTWRTGYAGLLPDILDVPFWSWLHRCGW